MPNNVISLDEAIRMTKAYRQKREEILADPYKNKDVLPICETFDREAFDIVLDNKECRKLRIYFGMDDKDLVKLIVVGVNEADEDMLPPAADARSAAETDENVIVENGIRCPVICPPPSVLNGND